MIKYNITGLLRDTKFLFLCCKIKFISPIFFNTLHTARGELEQLDQCKTLLNLPHTPPVTQQFAH